ncbi:MAG: class II aldolase/adducin family protein [Cypionkella sp.]|jgi:rhamnose utilization protein RhaD (predicted bifunctional aldolase and dehydrogenase)|nr:class II aldolase/adducin family protein [Cypionkella sp.]
MIDLSAFRALSARLGRDPLQVQGPGGNTSLKDGDTLWIKASGTELADAMTADIFVAVDRKAALAEALGLSGDGSCKATVLDPARGLRPSIETTFHAALDWPVVAHTHSIATLAHGVALEGTAAAAGKLADLPFAVVPYAKPGLPLTREILQRAQPETRIFLLENHGLICCGASVAETEALIQDVEQRLALPPDQPDLLAIGTPPAGHDWAPESWIARDDLATVRALAGSYYPDHVVFLGPALPRGVPADPRPACLIPGCGVALRLDATPAQRAMLRCLSDLLARVPTDWPARPIGTEAEASLLDWDAEKYRQALAART